MRKKETRNARDDRLDRTVREYFDIDAIGIENKHKHSTAEEQTLKILEETSRYIGNAWW